MRGIGKKAIEMLETKLGIKTIGDFNKWYNVPNNVDVFLRGVSGWTKRRVETLYAASSKASLGSPPADTVIDYRTADSPYERRYGEGWRDVIRSTTHMKKYVSINVLVKHMHDETQRVFQGTTHEDTWMFYHDALSLMTSKECQQYMVETGMMR